MTTIYKKLDKLKAFAERDCGHESTNAINLIKKLCEKHNIKGFSYTPWYDKKEEETVKNDTTWGSRQFAYSRKMKSILEAYLKSRIADGWEVKYEYSGTTLYIYASYQTYGYLIAGWNKVKREYKREQKNLKSYMENFARSL